MSALPAIAAILLLPLLLGLSLVRLLGLRVLRDPLYVLASAWTTGAMAVGLILFALLSCDLRPDGLLLWLTILGPTLIATYFARRRPGMPTLHPPRRWWGRLLFALGLGASLFVALDWMLAADARAVVAGDESGIWAAKAKAIWVSGGFNESFRERSGPGAMIFHKDYPLLNPLLQVFTFGLRGELCDVENRLPMQASMLALILVLGCGLARRLPLALAGLLLPIATTGRVWEFLSSYAYADHMVALGFALAVEAWLRFHEEGERRHLVLVGVGLSFMVWSKNEGTLILLALVCATLLARVLRRSWGSAPGPRLGPAAIPCLLSPLALIALQRAFNARFDFRNDLISRNSGDPLWVLIPRQFSERIDIVAKHFAEDLFWEPLFELPSLSLGSAGHAEHNAALGVVLLLFLLRPRASLRGALMIPVTAVAFALIGYYLVYIGSFHRDIAWHLETSSARVLFSLVPAALLLGAASLGAKLDLRGQDDADAMPTRGAKDA